jgi:hypothetical protein
VQCLNCFFSPDNKIGEQKHIPQAGSVYSLASEDIVQDEPLHTGATVGPRPANIPDTRAAISYASSDEISMRDGMQYGEQGGGIEMERMGIGKHARFFLFDLRSLTIR